LRRTRSKEGRKEGGREEGTWWEVFVHMFYGLKTISLVLRLIQISSVQPPPLFLLLYPRWERVRPPLIELEADEKNVLLQRLTQVKFKMPGLGE
jgi:hypothetical protein